MKEQFESLHTVMPEFMHGMIKVTVGTIASGAAFLISDVLPQQFDLAKNASQLTGWGLALVVIYTLWKVVVHLYAVIAQQNSTINKLLSDAAAELRKELEQERRNHKE